MYSINENLIIRKIEHNYVIINMESGEITTFEGTGNIFFETLLESKNELKMLEYLIEKYEVEEKILKEDIAEFLQSLLEKNIIQRA